MLRRSLLFTAALLSAGCSLILSTAAPDQCATDDDCQQNAAFRGRVCTKGFCVTSAEPFNNPDGGPPCTTTASCTNQNSGAPSICPTAGAQCIPLQTKDCPAVTGPYDNPNVILVGSILPFHIKQSNGFLQQQEYATLVQRAIDLGVKEVNDAYPNGIPFPGLAAQRPIAVVHCDSHFDRDQAGLMMQQLTQNVGVQAVIVGGDEEVVGVEALAAQQQTTVLCSDCLGPFPTPNSAWRIIPPLTQQAALAAWRVSDLETKIKAGANPPASIKVAVFEEPQRGPDAFVAALHDRLVFNGKSADANGDNYTVERDEDPRVKVPDPTAHINALTTMAPDIIVVVMGSDFPALYLTAIESQWPSGKAKPQYVFTSLLYETASFADPLTNAHEQAADLVGRMSGTRSADDPALDANITSYTDRYRALYNHTLPDGNWSGYDAFYALTYAIAATTIQTTFNGPQITAGLTRLRAGDTIDFGPAALSHGIGLLSGGDTIDVRGLWSGLDWDVATHDLTVDAGMYCFTYPNGVLTLKPDAGVRYVQATGNVTGTYVCE